ncbi:thiol reductant ABC exporter subunit CydC [Neobacillus cucumis]|uniref:Thiol reductant ABC exporter subunit CydC n=1 Tax=Neobacillus cucumis TaxID=1740721 RepID=A0A2N5HDH0_9BACI|nr:thiol reductant ABC exporter subunit CydC [Neobacillus cucumis]PLS03540.1 thiol reductant ABC exporter subunit CydC [Neobacillus cucumis]
MNKDKWILPYICQYRWLFIISILLASLTTFFGGALMFTSGYLISKAATRPESILMVYVPIVGVRTFGIGRAVFTYIERLTGHSLVLKILSQLRVKLYQLVGPQALFIRSRFRTGDLLGVLSNDIEHLQDFYLKTILPAAVSIVIYGIMITCAGILSRPFALILAIFVSLIVFLSPFFSLIYMKARKEELKQGRNQSYQQFTDAILGISDLIFSGQSHQFIQRNIRHEHKLLKVDERIHSFVNWRDLFHQLILGLIVIFAVYSASEFTLAGEVPPTLIAAFALVLLSLLESFLPIAGAISDTPVYQDSIKRLTTTQADDFNTKVQIDELKELDLSNITIKVQGLTFTYAEEQVIRNINLTVNQGEKIAVIGRSGSGKSTFLKLIYGALVPTLGTVTVHGQAVHKLEASISNVMSVLNQQSYLFNTSVLNNIRLGNPKASDEEVYEAARLVQLDEMIGQLPKGYDTIMQETGQRFSGGERQRIALARILLQDNPVVLLDEPTVGLDPITEVKLLKTIFETLQGKTIIWVTHHLIGVESMDRVLFLEGGKIAMDGTHQQLVEQESRYRRLYALDRPFS